MKHREIICAVGTNVGTQIQLHGSKLFGSVELTEALRRAQPRYALCGHIHSGDHKAYELVHANGSTTLIRNVSRLNEDYRIAYEPFVFEL